MVIYSYTSKVFKVSSLCQSCGITWFREGLFQQRIANELLE